MIDKREDNMDNEDQIMKALTYGLKLSNHGVDESVIESIQRIESSIIRSSNPNKQSIQSQAAKV